MPQVPIIIPIIVVGGLVGSLLKSKRQKIPRRKVLSWSLIAGLLNAGFAYAELIMTPQQTTTFRGTTFVAQISPIAFTASSFLVGFLIVLAVFGIAAIFLRMRKGDSEPEEEEEPELEEESSKLKLG